MRRMMAVAASLLLVAGLVQADPADDARAIIDNAITAQGGAANLGKFKGAVIRSKGRFHGMGQPIDYTSEDFVTAVRRITDDRGVDVVFDPVGGSVLTQSLRAIAWGGRVLVVGFASGAIPELAANRILLKGCSVIGVRAGEAARQDPERGRAALAALLDYAARGHLRPHISHRLPLSDFARGMRLLMEREAIGRVVLIP